MIANYLADLSAARKTLHEARANAAAALDAYLAADAAADAWIIAADNLKAAEDALDDLDGAPS